MTEVIADFARFGDEVQKKSMESAGRKAANLMKKEAVRSAPRSLKDRSKMGKVTISKNGEIGLKYGYLRKHLREQINIQKVNSRESDVKYLIRVADAFWANFLEAGTKDRTHKTGKRVGRIDKTKSAFLKKIPDRLEPEIIRIVESEIDLVLSKFR